MDRGTTPPLCRYKGSADAFVNTWRHEGPRALYKGFLPNSWTIVATQAYIYITTYEYQVGRTAGGQ